MPKKILVADDDPISLLVLKKYLDEAGFSYAVAKDGKQAWERLNQAPEEFKLIIADRIMPHLHGVDLLIKMQQDVLLKKIPVVIITGEAEKEEIIAAVKAGAFDFLYKPVEKNLLLAVVRKALFYGIIPE